MPATEATTRAATGVVPTVLFPVTVIPARVSAVRSAGNGVSARIAAAVSAPDRRTGLVDAERGDRRDRAARHVRRLPAVRGHRPGEQRPVADQAAVDRGDACRAQPGDELVDAGAGRPRAGSARGQQDVTRTAEVEVASEDAARARRRSSAALVVGDILRTQRGQAPPPP